MATIKRHEPDNDWCHICGSREHRTVDIWYPQNAEHATDEQAAAQRGPDIKYIRICSHCAQAVALAFNVK